MIARLVGFVAAAALVGIVAAAPASASVPREPLDDGLPVDLPPVTVPSLELPVLSSALPVPGLFGGSVSPSALPATSEGAPPLAAAPPGSSLVPADAAGSGLSPSRSIGAGRVAPVPGTGTVLRLARSSTALIALLAVAVAFLVVQGRLDRRSPRLASAPLDRRDELLEFS